jgi:hypothetical protein
MKADASSRPILTSSPAESKFREVCWVHVDPSSWDVVEINNLMQSLTTVERTVPCMALRDAYLPHDAANRTGSLGSEYAPAALANARHTGKDGYQGHLSIHVQGC